MSREAPALFRRFPQAEARIPWISLGEFPTPVHELAGLAERLAPARGFIKRDDLASPTYGGNKVRILEFLLVDARSRGCDVVLTAGALGSHHVSATALFGRQLGTRVEAVLWHQPWIPRCAEALHTLAHLGVPVRYAPSPAMAVASLLWRWWGLRRRSTRACLLPPGGLSPQGALGFVDAALELAEQIEEGGVPSPDHVWLACGTGVSAAGLCVGAALAGLPARVRAVRVTPRLVCNVRRVSALAGSARRLLRRAGIPCPAPAPVQISHTQYAPGYATPSPAAERAAAALREQGIRLDTT